MANDSSINNSQPTHPLVKLSIRDFVISGLAAGVACGALALAVLWTLILIRGEGANASEDPAIVESLLFLVTVLIAAGVLIRTATSGIYVRGTTVKFRKVFYTKTVAITDIASMRLSSGIDTWPIFTLVDGTEVSMPLVVARRFVAASKVSSLSGKLVKLRDLLVLYGATDLTGL